MKKTAYYLAFSLLMVGGLFVQQSQAQSSSCPRLTAKIPFEFNVRTATLPAGEYEISCTSTRSDAKVLQLRRRGTSVNAMVQTSVVNGKARESSKLVFNRYGDNYYLAQLWVSDEPIGMQIRKSDAERGLSKQIAQTRPEVETIALTQRR